MHVKCKKGLISGFCIKDNGSASSVFAAVCFFVVCSNMLCFGDFKMVLGKKILKFSP